MDERAKLNVFTLAIKNISGNSFRSFIIFLCVMGMAGFFFATTLIIWGAEYSLNSGLERLGADIIVVPAGAETKVESALLMAKPTQMWMARDKLDKIGKIPGVAAASPQYYLSSLYGAPCCSVWEMFIVVFDPATDFTIRPWLESEGIGKLAKNEVIGGSAIVIPSGEKFIKLYGHNLSLKGNLKETGIGIDQTLFMSLETAEAMAETSLTQAMSPLQWNTCCIVLNSAGEVISQDVNPALISAVLVKVQSGADVRMVAQQIMLNDSEVTAITSPNLFGTFHKQLTGLLWGFLAILSMCWMLSAALIGLIFSMAANERRREISVLRAMGATRQFASFTLLMEAGLLAVTASLLGILLAAFGTYLFRDFLTATLKIPFLFPSPASFLSLLIGGILLTLLIVTLAALIPALRITGQEPAIAMRE
ncbi:MAG: ABC transporter permease [Chloroflexi bacterium]|nr:ABC transporter permease [Chloroflexota bacterium]